MKWFLNLSTFTKMMIGFGVLGLITAGIGWFGVSQLGSLNAQIGDSYQNQLEPLGLLDHIQDEMHQIHHQTIRLFTPIDDKDGKDFVKNAGELDKSVAEKLGRLSSKLTDKEKESFSKLKELVTVYKEFREKYIYLPVMKDQKAPFDEAGRDRTEFKAVLAELNNLTN